MKRILSFLLLTALILNLPFAANAVENKQERVCYADGSYVIIEMIESATRESGSKTAKKQYSYYDNNDIQQWKVVLTGKFTYTGDGATCTSSSVDVTINYSAWYVVSKSADKSGNKAEASVRVGEKLSGTTVKVVPVDLTLTCDADGNLS